MVTRTDTLVFAADPPEDMSGSYAGGPDGMLGMLGPGDFLSISYPCHMVRTIAAAYGNHPGTMTIGFDDNMAALSMSSLRDMLFAGAEAGKTLAVLDMSCFAGYFSERNVLKILERERDLEAMSAALRMGIVAVYDDEQVDPHVAMTQPFIYDCATTKLVRNHFGVPVRHLIRRLESVDDIGWFHAFNERSTQLRLA